MGYEPLALLPVSILIGFLVFAQLVRSRWKGDWLWLETWGERLGFFLWPRPPANIVKLITLSGEQLLLYNVPIRERKEQVIIDTPLGKVTSPEKASTVLPLTAVYLPSRPSPMVLVAYALAGLIAAWLVFYYGYLALGFKPDTVFVTLTIVMLAYVYMYYQAASSNGVEYHEYEVRGLAPPFMHAVPSSAMVSPLKAAKYTGTPILIRVSKSVQEALDLVKKALGVEETSQAAELLALGEAYDTVVKKAVSLRVHSSRIQEALGAFQTLTFSIGRITVGKAVLALVIFLIGVFVGWALSDKLVIGPPPGPVTTGYNYNLTGVTGP
ncbi:MAG: hypothetical protein GSR78_01590 [Desulfurococcales archaeon]|nr:hypothetical protein [Desulfurococcales archaeon]